ncbi:hypothetical protein MITS9504_01279 [Synechococcus sp. MIT S9504]|nr:hypothetical protein MITS9504_01279 [Synechococcus sp. MIT S9504]
MKKELVTIRVSLDPRVIELIDTLKKEWAFHSRSAVINRLLSELGGLEEPSSVTHTDL